MQNACRPPVSQISINCCCDVTKLTVKNIHTFSVHFGCPEVMCICTEQVTGATNRWGENTRHTYV